jgi:hypothetical protein
MAVYQQLATSLVEIVNVVNPLIVQIHLFQLFHFRELSFDLFDLTTIAHRCALAIHLPQVLFAVCTPREGLASAHLERIVLLIRTNELTCIEQHQMNPRFMTVS